MAYTYQDLGNQINALRGSGNEAQAWAMFNGLSGMGNATQAAGGVAGNLDSYLRTLWGDSAAKQWINNMDTKYGNTSFDPTTGKWAGMGQANGQSGTIAGWDPTKYNAAGMGVAGQGYVPEGYGSGAAGFAGSTAVGVQGDGKTPFASTGLPGRVAPPMPAKGAPGSTGLPVDPSLGAGVLGGGPPMVAPGAGAGSPWDFFNDEGYQFRLKEGMDNIKGDAAAGGMLQSGKTLKALADYNSGLASQEYDNAFGRFTNQRDFNRGVYQDDRDFGESARRYNTDFGESARRYNQDFGESARRYDQGFSEDQRRNNRDFDWAYGRDERDYLTGLDRYNSEMDYRYGLDDRNWQTNTLMDLARMGLGATGSSGNLAQSLAQMFGGNTLAGANAGAAGTMGGANNINNMISQIMNYLANQQMVGNIFGARP